MLPAALVTEYEWLLAMQLLRPHSNGERMCEHTGWTHYQVGEREREKEGESFFVLLGLY